MSELNVGDRIRLSGGHDMEPAWLVGREAYWGTVVEFIPGQNDTPAAVVRLDAAISSAEITGDIVVLELRYVGAQWSKSEVVHVELCDFVPERTTWSHRKQGKWVESHATYAMA